MMFVADAYQEGFKGGARLRAYPAPLEQCLRHLDDPNTERLHPQVRRRLVSYVVGFSDGWHGLPPIHPVPS